MPLMGEHSPVDCPFPKKRRGFPTRGGSWLSVARGPGLVSRIPGPEWNTRSKLVKLYLARKRTLWMPTWQGSLVLLGLVLAFAFLFVSGFHSFLAKTERVNADILVVEGWVPDYALEFAVREFHRGEYRYLCTTGGPLDHGSHLAPFDSWAKLAASTLQALGTPEAKLVVAPAPAAQQHRTFRAASSLRENLAAARIEQAALNVVTLGTHARRTQLIYEKVFGDEVEIGIVSVPSREYDPDRWWASSSGAKTVLTEGLGWLGEWIADSGRPRGLD